MLCNSRDWPSAIDCPIRESKSSDSGISIRQLWKISRLRFYTKVMAVFEGSDFRYLETRFMLPASENDDFLALVITWSVNWRVSNQASTPWHYLMCSMLHSRVGRTSPPILHMWSNAVYLQFVARTTSHRRLIWLSAISRTCLLINKQINGMKNWWHAWRAFLQLRNQPCSPCQCISWSVSRYWSHRASNGNWHYRRKACEIGQQGFWGCAWRSSDRIGIKDVSGGDHGCLMNLTKYIGISVSVRSIIYTWLATYSQCNWPCIDAYAFAYASSCKEYALIFGATTAKLTIDQWIKQMLMPVSAL